MLAPRRANQWTRATVPDVAAARVAAVEAAAAAPRARTALRASAPVFTPAALLAVRPAVAGAPGAAPAAAGACAPCAAAPAGEQRPRRPSRYALQRPNQLLRVPSPASAGPVGRRPAPDISRLGAGAAAGSPLPAPPAVRPPSLVRTGRFSLAPRAVADSGAAAARQASSPARPAERGARGRGMSRGAASGGRGHGAEASRGVARGRAGAAALRSGGGPRPLRAAGWLAARGGRVRKPRGAPAGNRGCGRIVARHASDGKQVRLFQHPLCPGVVAGGGRHGGGSAEAAHEDARGLQVLLYKRAERGLKLERSGVAAARGATSLSWSRVPVRPVVQPAHPVCRDPRARRRRLRAGRDGAGSMPLLSFREFAPCAVQAAVQTAERVAAARARQGGSARAAAAAAMLRRALGRSAAGRARAGAAVRQASGVRARRPLPSRLGAAGGVRLKPRPARLVRVGGAMYRVSGGRSLMRQPGTPRPRRTPLAVKARRSSACALPSADRR